MVERFNADNKAEETSNARARCLAMPYGLRRGNSDMQVFHMFRIYNSSTVWSSQQGLVIIFLRRRPLEFKNWSDSDDTKVSGKNRPVLKSYTKEFSMALISSSVTFSTTTAVYWVNPKAVRDQNAGIWKYEGTSYSCKIKYTFISFLSKTDTKRLKGI